jgi:signal transduction histidine kinase
MSLDLREQAPWLEHVDPAELRHVISALYRVHQFIASITDLDTLLERVMEVSKELVPSEACSLLLYDAGSEELYFHVALGERGDQQALKREIRLKLGEGIAGQAASSRETITSNDAGNDPRLYRAADAASQFETRTVVAVPLVDRDQLVGVLELVNKLGGALYNETDVRMMEIFSVLSATAIANARLIEENLRAERMAAIGEAVAGLSHYTKNLITGLGTSAELIDEGIARNDQELLRQVWPLYRRSTRRIAHFVGDMMAFSKPRTPVLQRFAVTDLIAEVKDTFWALLSQKQITLEVDLQSQVKNITADQQGIYRCVLNLLTNAADAVEPGTGWIGITVRRDRHSIIISVADNGPGIPRDLRGRIFEPFFSTKGSQGTGLGLAVANKIAHEHGGKIEVDTSDRGGAVFRLVLPRALEAELRRAKQ